jgi:hypothetical protein
MVVTSSASSLTDLVEPALDRSYVERRIEDWANRISALYAQIERWLPPELTVRQGRSVAMYEDLMERANVPARKLPVLDVVGANGTLAVLEPAGLWVVGVNGRLFLKAPTGPFHIVDLAEKFDPPAWHLAPIVVGRTFEPLTQASFLKTLA